MITEEVTVCPMWASTFEVVSSNGETTYIVQFHKFEPTTCTCPAWKYSGEYGEQICKHIKGVLKHGCFSMPIANYRIDAWEDELKKNEIMLISTTKDVTDDPCPGCQRPMTTVWIKD